MAQLVIPDVRTLRDWVGKKLGCSDWLEMSQKRIDLFAEATGDKQWIHVDPERAKRESPFGGTIAHGHLTLSLAPFFFGQIVEVKGVRMVVNPGIEHMRLLRDLQDEHGGFTAFIHWPFQPEGTPLGRWKRMPEPVGSRLPRRPVPDGKHLLSTGRDGLIRVWEAGRARTAVGAGGPVTASARSADGAYLAVVVGDGVRLHRVADLLAAPAPKD